MRLLELMRSSGRAAQLRLERREDARRQPEQAVGELQRHTAEGAAPNVRGSAGDVPASQRSARRRALRWRSELPPVDVVGRAE